VYCRSPATASDAGFWAGRFACRAASAGFGAGAAFGAGTGSSARGAGAFGQIMRRAQREPHALGQLVLRQKHEVVEILVHEIEGEVERDPSGDTFSEGVRGGAHDALRPQPRTTDRVGLLCPDADDARL